MHNHKPVEVLIIVVHSLGNIELVFDFDVARINQLFEFVVTKKFLSNLPYFIQLSMIALKRILKVVLSRHLFIL